MREITFSKKKLVMIVDDEDYDWISKRKWHQMNGYPKTHFKSTHDESIPLHLLLMGCPLGENSLVDHINRNCLDNRKENLRLATYSQNSMNRSKTNRNCTSQYKGVVFHKNRYYVKVVHQGTVKRIGLFSDETASANAYNYYARQLHGEFAVITDVEYMPKEEWESFRYRHSTPYKGVHWIKAESKFRCSYTYPKTNKKVILGWFDDDLVAANYFNHMMKDEIPVTSLNIIPEEDIITLAECESKRIIPQKSSKYRGVCFDKESGKWKAAIQHNKKSHRLGRFNTEIEAAIAYNQKAIEMNIPNLANKLNEI